MQDYPHRYKASAQGGTEGIIDTGSPGLENIPAMPPPEFDGPGDKWSPETMLVAAVANCFILTFRAIARASKLEWESLEASADGVLERVERVTKFTSVTVKATLTVPADTDEEKARRLLQKAEDACLITNSMTAETHLEADIIAAP